jgi:hypothetical protein
MNYLITYGLPDRDETPRGKAYDHNGKPTTNKAKWEKFFTYEEAKEFAETHGIELDNFSSSIVSAK